MAVQSAATCTPGVRPAFPDNVPRVMLHPEMAARGALPAAALAQLEAAAGTTLTLAGTTRTGALDLVPGKPLEFADAEAIARRLRENRGVLWVQPQTALTATKRARKSEQSDATCQRLLVRLHD